MDLEVRKTEYIKHKYQKIANDILELINTPVKLKQEVKLSCFGLWRIYHNLDMELAWMRDILESNNGEDMSNLRKHKCPFGSCEDIRAISPTF